MKVEIVYRKKKINRISKNGQNNKLFIKKEKENKEKIAKMVKIINYL